MPKPGGRDNPESLPQPLGYARRLSQVDAHMCPHLIYVYQCDLAMFWLLAHRTGIALADIAS
jgi:hypothetical protein